MSWCPAPGGYRLFFNRDEQKTREAADPPQALQIGGGEILAARDGRAGGTWLFVNRHGLSVAILNHYAADGGDRAARPASHASRGLLVFEFAACRDIEGFRARVPERCRAAAYRPFLLLAIARSAAVSLWRWDGLELLEIDAPPNRFLTTSSFRSTEVIRYRAVQRHALGDEPSPEALRSLHQQHDPERPAHSIRMRRDDAQTVSYSELAVDGERVSYRYRPERLDDLELREAVWCSLPREV